MLRRSIFITMTLLSIGSAGKLKSDNFYLYALERKFQISLDAHDSIIEMRYLSRISCGNKDTLEFDIQFFMDSFKSKVVKIQRSDSLIHIHSSFLVDSTVLEFVLLEQEHLQKYTQIDNRSDIKAEIVKEIFNRLDSYHLASMGYGENYILNLLLFQSLLLEYKIDPEICYEEWWEIHKHKLD